MLSISDHSLVRVWFKLKNDLKPIKWNKKKYKIVTWISKEEDRMELCKEDFKEKIGKKISFKKCMKKLKNSMNKTMRRTARIKLGCRGNKKMIAGEWMDDELIDNIKLRCKYSR